VTTTFVATAGPSFVATIVYVTVLFNANWSPLTLFVMLTSVVSGETMAGEAVKLPLAGFGSAVVEVTVAVFVIVPVAVGATWNTNENVADVPLTSDAIEQLIVPVPPDAG
jgi:hypothetical protein